MQLHVFLKTNFRRFTTNVQFDLVRTILSKVNYYLVKKKFCCSSRGPRICNKPLDQQQKSLEHIIIILFYLVFLLSMLHLTLEHDTNNVRASNSKIVFYVNWIQCSYSVWHYHTISLKFHALRFGATNSGKKFSKWIVDFSRQR